MAAAVRRAGRSARDPGVLVQRIMAASKLATMTQIHLIGYIRD